MNDMTKYKENYLSMETGDLLDYFAYGPMGWVINKYSPGSTHSGLVIRLADYEGEEHRRWTLEAVGTGVNLVLLSHKMETYDGIVRWHHLKPEYDSVRQKIGEWAICQVGVIHYDFKGLVRNLFGHVSADLQELWCSEYVGFGWKAGGIDIGNLGPRPSDLPKFGVTEPPVEIIRAIPGDRPEIPVVQP